MIYDFAIIGGGMAGASLAAELAPHARVLVLEGEDMPGYHSTGRSAAFWEECYGGPGVVPLTLPSGAFLRERGFLKERGALYIGQEEDKTELDAFLETFKGSGVGIERLDRAGLAAKIPNLRDIWSDAIWEPACADIDVAGLHQHYLQSLRRSGAELRCRSRVVKIERSDGSWTITTERGETQSAARIVNAAGAWADSIAALAGVQPIGIEPKRRTMVQLRVTPEVSDDLPLVLDVKGEFYFKPDSGRIWLSPHDEIASEPCDAAPDEFDIAQAINRFERATSWKIEAAERSWAGLRSFAPDRLPVYGEDPMVQGFYWFAGQGGFGIQTAPAAARLGAQIMLGHERDAMTRSIDERAFSPQRFNPQLDARTG